MKRVEVAGANDKCQITAVLCASLKGAFLLLQIIYRGKNARCHPQLEFPSEWDITHAIKHWWTKETMKLYVHDIIVPYVESVCETLGERKLAMIIMDNFKRQTTTEIHQLLEENDIYVCLLPRNTTDSLQPLNVSVNQPAKDFLLKKLQEWYSNQTSQQLDSEDIKEVDLKPVDLSMPVLKEMGSKWLVEMANYHKFLNKSQGRLFP